jgi:mevalonate kinase
VRDSHLIIASAPAKVILTGEHFVVHGQPALAAAIDIYSKVTVRSNVQQIIEITSSSLGITNKFSIKQLGKKINLISNNRVMEPLKHIIEKILQIAGQVDCGLKIQIDSEIPVGVGLGSSASTAVSTTMAVAKYLNLELEKNEIFEIASIQEKLIHKKPSGIDCTTATYGGVIFFKIGKISEYLQPNNNINIVIGDTRNKRSTGDLVTRVTQLVNLGNGEISRISESAGKLTIEAVRSYREGDFETLGKIMNKNHKLLQKIGISTIQLDQFVKVSRQAGALGAKLTGAGGGGCMIALCRPKNKYKIANAIENAGGRSYIVSIDETGVKSENSST